MSFTHAPRLPRTTWEHCLSAGDELAAWHLAESSEPVDVLREQRLVVVLLAVAMHDLAAAAGLTRASIAEVRLTAPDGQDSVLGTVRHHALSVLQSCPATEVLGAGEREQLAAAYGTGAFSAVQAAVEKVLLHHAQAADEEGQPHPTCHDRAPAMAHAHRAALLRVVGDIFGEEF
jgi:hypothetical protein